MKSKRRIGVLLLLFVMVGAAHATAVSDDAKRHMARGTAAMRLANSPAEFRDAVNEFRQATQLAPNWADAWFNLGVAQESAEAYADAIASFKTYLEKSPSAADRDTVQTRIFELEYMQEKAAARQSSEQSQQQLIAALQQGRWHQKNTSRTSIPPNQLDVIEKITVSGEGRVNIRVIHNLNYPSTVNGYRIVWPRPGRVHYIYEGSLSGRHLSGRYREWWDESQPPNTGTFEGTVSADGRTMDLALEDDKFPQMAPYQVIYVRE